MNFEAKVTISCDSRGTFTLTIEDRASGMDVVEVEMTPHDFAMALASRGLQPGKGRFHPQVADRVGKLKEVAHVHVHDTREWQGRLSNARRGTPEHEAVLAELHAALLATKPEGEGWQVWADGHRSQQNGPLWAGVLVRWIDPPAEDTPPPTED